MRLAKTRSIGLQLVVPAHVCHPDTRSPDRLGLSSPANMPKEWVCIGENDVSRSSLLQSITAHAASSAVPPTLPVPFTAYDFEAWNHVISSHELGVAAGRTPVDLLVRATLVRHTSPMLSLQACRQRRSATQKLDTMPFTDKFEADRPPSASYVPEAEDACIVAVQHTSHEWQRKWQRQVPQA